MVGLVNDGPILHKRCSVSVNRRCRCECGKILHFIWTPVRGVTLNVKKNLTHLLVTAGLGGMLVFWLNL